MYQNSGQISGCVLTPLLSTVLGAYDWETLKKCPLEPSLYELLNQPSCIIVHMLYTLHRKIMNCQLSHSNKANLCSGSAWSIWGFFSEWLSCVAFYSISCGPGEEEGIQNQTMTRQVNTCFFTLSLIRSNEKKKSLTLSKNALDHSALF